MRRLGPYVLEELLGSGGSAQVWRGRAPDGREVAVKLSTRSGERGQQRFLREVGLLASLGQVQGFVPLLDWGESDGGSYLVMPLIRGGTLADRLARGTLPVAQVRSLLRSLAAALAEAHARGIVHRDLKPANILVPPEGRPLVADLGVGLLMGSSPRLSLTGEFRGTPGYAAPEQLADASRAGPAADVFALGVMAWECLSGQRPFQGDTVAELVASCEQGPGALRALCPEVPPALEAVILRALSLDPADRPADARALLMTLEPERVDSPRRRTLIAALGGVALLGVLWISTAGRRQAAPAPAEVLAVASGAVWHSPAERAQVRLGQGDLDGAVAELDLACTTRAPDPAALATWGRLRVLRGDVQGGLAALHRAAALAPADGDILALKGLVREELGQDGSLELLRAARDHPESARAHEALAVCALRSTEGPLPDVVEPAARRTLELDPASPGAWTALARLAALRGDRPAAERLVEQALACGVVAPDSLVARGELRHRDGDLVGAFVDAQRALELAPWSCEARLLRATLRRQVGDATGARADLEAVLRVSGEHPGGLVLAAVLTLAEDQPAEAERLASQILARRRDPDALLARALARVRLATDAELDQVRLKDAEEDALGCVQLAPGRTAAWALLASVSLLQDQAELALEALGNGRRVGLSPAEFHGIRALQLSLYDELHLAVEGLAERLHTLRPRHAPPSDALLRLHAQARAVDAASGIYPELLIGLQRALLSEPGRAATWAALAGLLAREQPPRATAYMEVALALDPCDPALRALHARLLADRGEDARAAQEQAYAERLVAAARACGAR